MSADPPAARAHFAFASVDAPIRETRLLIGRRFVFPSTPPRHSALPVHRPEISSHDGSTVNPQIRQRW